MKTLGVGMVIGLGVLWSCGGGLGFDPPDEDELSDVWTEELYDGDIAGELEFQRTDEVYIVRDDFPLVEQSRGTFSLSSADDPDYTSIHFTPQDGAPYVKFILFYDSQTLDLAGDTSHPYDPSFGPSHRRRN